MSDPLGGEVFHARLGGGAWLDRPDGQVAPQRLVVSRPDGLLSALVGTGFGYRPQDRAWQGELAAALLPRVRDIRRAGSAALDLVSVAAGRLDGHVESFLQPWDLAAGWLVVTEAGGLVSGLYGAPPSADGIVAAGPSVHGELLALVEEHMPESRRRATG